MYSEKTCNMLMFAVFCTSHLLNNTLLPEIVFELEFCFLLARYWYCWILKNQPVPIRSQLRPGKSVRYSSDPEKVFLNVPQFYLHNWIKTYDIMTRNNQNWQRIYLQSSNVSYFHINSIALPYNRIKAVPIISSVEVC